MQQTQASIAKMRIICEWRRSWALYYFCRPDDSLCAAEPWELFTAGHLA